MNLFKNNKFLIVAIIIIVGSIVLETVILAIRRTAQTTYTPTKVSCEGICLAEKNTLQSVCTGLLQTQCTAQKGKCFWTNSCDNPSANNTDNTNSRERVITSTPDQIKSYKPAPASNVCNKCSASYKYFSVKFNIYGGSCNNIDDKTIDVKQERTIDMNSRIYTKDCNCVAGDIILPDSAINGDSSIGSCLDNS